MRVAVCGEYRAASFPNLINDVFLFWVEGVDYFGGSYTPNECIAMRYLGGVMLCFRCAVMPVDDVSPAWK